MKRSIFLVVSVIIIALTGCKKDQSTFNGSVRYKDSTGTFQTASNAEISIFRDVLGGTAEMITTTNSDGQYALRDVKDGHYIVYGEVSVGEVTYTGQTGLLFCEKDDIIDADLDLE